MADSKSEEQQAEAEVLEASDFDSLLQKEFKPKSERSKEAVETAVQTLAEQLLKETAIISSDVIGTILQWGFPRFSNHQCRFLEMLTTRTK